MDDFNTTGSTACSGGHWFAFAGDPIGRLPDGYLCQCGATKYARREAILAEIEVLRRELDAEPIQYPD